MPKPTLRPNEHLLFEWGVASVEGLFAFWGTLRVTNQRIMFIPQRQFLFPSFLLRPRWLFGGSPAEIPWPDITDITIKAWLEVFCRGAPWEENVYIRARPGRSLTLQTTNAEALAERIRATWQEITASGEREHADSSD